MKTCYYIDTYSYRTMHEQFNASLLAMCAYSFDNVEYISGKSTNTNVVKLLTKGGLSLANIKWREIAVWKGDNRLDIILRLIFSALQNIRIVLFANSEQILIFNYNNLFSLFTVNLICKIFRRKVLIFCHGEMEFLIEKEDWGGVGVRAQRRLASKFFLSPKRKSNIYFAVMGDSILANVKQVINKDMSNRFISIDHSYIFGNHTPQRSSVHPLKIGTVGVLTQHKGLDALCEIAKKLDRANSVKLSVTGRIFGNYRQLINFGINLPQHNGTQPLDSDEFNERISKLDYILFLYPTTSYKLIASGAIMDALDKKRPIISLRNDYFEYLFNKYGAFGYLVDTLDEIVSVIENIGEHNDEKFNFEDMQKRLNPQELSLQFKDMLTSIGYF